MPLSALRRPGLYLSDIETVCQGMFGYDGFGDSNNLPLG
jgi:hypothetical protein